MKSLLNSWAAWLALWEQPMVTWEKATKLLQQDPAPPSARSPFCILHSLTLLGGISAFNVNAVRSGTSPLSGYQKDLSARCTPLFTDDARLEALSCCCRTSYLVPSAHVNVVVVTQRLPDSFVIQQLRLHIKWGLGTQPASYSPHGSLTPVTFRLSASPIACPSVSQIRPRYERVFQLPSPWWKLSHLRQLWYPA
jgi:hypothetical protein